MPDVALSPESRPAGTINARIPVVNTDILLIDFVGFSMLDDAGQYVAISVVSRVVVGVLDKIAREVFGRSMHAAIGWVPTGDGFYIILDPQFTGCGVFITLALRHVLLTRVNQTVGFKGVRCAVQHGPAIPFDDVTGKRNFIGTGLNDAARLLSLKPEAMVMARNFHRDDNSIAVSDSALDYLFTVYPRSEIQHFLDVAGWRQSAKYIHIDKHGKQHPYYFVDILRDNMPVIPRIINPLGRDGLS